MRLIKANPLFGWLPPVALFRLAARVEELELLRGAVLLREGDLGESAYLLESGELLAEQNGREIGRVYPGGVVGDIALLQARPAWRPCAL